MKKRHVFFILIGLLASSVVTTTLADYDMPMQLQITTTVNQTIYGNSTDDIFAVVDNDTFHKYTTTMIWSNLTGYNLDVAWIGTLEGGNISNPITYNATYDTYTASADTNASTACSGDQLLAGDGECVALSDGWNRTDQGNTSDQIWVAIDNATYHKHSDTMNWDNISSGWDLNEVWANSLDWGNISNAQIVNSSYEWFDNTTIFLIYNSSYEWYDNTTIFLASNSSYDWFDNTTIFLASNSSYDWFDNTTIFLTYNSTYDSNIDTDTDTNASTACSGDQLLAGDGECLALVSGWNTTSFGNTSEQMHDAINNDTYHKYSDTMIWGNLSTWSLNNGWTGSLSWGNLSDLNLDSIWTGSLDWGNISNAQIVNSSYEWFDNTTIFLMANSSYEWFDNTTIFLTYNSTYDSNIDTDTDTNASTACSGDQVLAGDGECLALVSNWNTTNLDEVWTGSLHGGNITADSLTGSQIAELADADISNTLTASDLITAGAVVNDTEVDDDITVASSKYVNSTAGMHLGDDDDFYFGTDDDARIYWNGTNLIIEG